MARLIDADALLNRFNTEIPIRPVSLTYDMGTVLKAIMDSPTVDAEPVRQWISVEDRLPTEIHSIFWPWYGKKEWSNAMWREQSDEVLVTVTFKDGTRLVATGETHDGEWRTSISKTLNPIVTHWMPLPEPPKGEHDGSLD